MNMIIGAGNFSLVLKKFSFWKEVWPLDYYYQNFYS